MAVSSVFIVFASGTPKPVDQALAKLSKAELAALGLDQLAAEKQG